MSDAIAHRGPDGEGMHLDRGLGLGHRRLAILDLSDAGDQPMPYADGRYWLIFNGEIYNFLELRAELTAKGYTFRSDSDTEVVLAAYDAWGPDCLLRFNGMWAFAIWDSQRAELFLARDRFGIKPLYYLPQPHRFAFASEMKAFRHLSDYNAEVDWPVFKAELLDMHSQEGGENTLFAGVRRLRPGHYAIVTSSGPRIVRWWRTLDHLVEVPRGLDEQAARFRELFEDACRLRMRSDVPIGTSLSGGLDSSSVVSTVAHVARQGGQRVPTDWQRAFIATFPGTPVDEQRYADAVIARAGIQPVYREIRPEDALAQLQSSVYHVEDLESAPLSQLYLLYRAQRQHGVVVTLDGHGGDELLAGYPGYVVSALYDAGAPFRWPGYYLDLRDIYGHMMRSAADAGPKDGVGALTWDTSAWLRLLRQSAGRVGLSVGPRRPSTVVAPGWFAPDFAELLPAPPTPADAIGSASVFRKHLYRDFHEAVLQVILRNYDRLSMASGVEVRMPLLDWRVVTYAWSLPMESLLGQGYSKLILRKAMRGLVPDAVLDRRDKIGFASPMSQWLTGPWRSWLTEVVNAPDFLDSPVWNGRAIRDHIMATDQWNWHTWTGVWKFIHAYLWLRCFAPQKVSA